MSTNIRIKVKNPLRGLATRVRIEVRTPPRTPPKPTRFNTPVPTSSIVLKDSFRMPIVLSTIIPPNRLTNVVPSTSGRSVASALAGPVIGCAMKNCAAQLAYTGN